MASSSSSSSWAAAAATAAAAAYSFSPQSLSEKEEAELHYLILNFLESSSCENTFQVYKDEAMNLGILPNRLSYEEVKDETHLNRIPPKFLLEILRAAGTLLRRQELGEEYESITEKLLCSSYENENGAPKLSTFLTPEVVGAITRINCNPMNSLAHHTSNRITPMGKYLHFCFFVIH